MTSFSASAAAAACRKAMKGLGTDDKALINTLCVLDNEQLQKVRQAYATEIQRDLIEDIKSETSSEYERALTGIVYTRAEFDAKQLNKAVKGVGTDEDVFIQTLCHRTTEEIKAIEAAYLEMFSKKLTLDIQGDFSGEGQLVALGLIKYARENPKNVVPAEVDAWVDVLYNAGEGKMGTDEEAFVEAICSSGPAWLKAVNEAYGRKHGHTLVGAVQKEFSGFASKTLEAMIQNHDDYYANLIHEACKGAGTEEDLLTRVLVSRRHRLKDINNAYMAKFNVGIAHTVEKEVDGDYGKVLKAIVANA